MADGHSSAGMKVPGLFDTLMMPTVRPLDSSMILNMQPTKTPSIAMDRGLRMPSPLPLGTFRESSGEIHNGFLSKGGKYRVPIPRRSCRFQSALGRATRGMHIKGKSQCMLKTWQLLGRSIRLGPKTPEHIMLDYSLQPDVQEVRLLSGFKSSPCNQCQKDAAGR